MKISRNKTAATMIALFLVLTIAATLVALPIANAHDPAWTVPTWCYVAVANSIIGVNQQQLIVFWLNAVPPTAQGAYGDSWTFYVDITKPDGTKETLGPFTSDPVGGSYALYTPDQLGTYTIVAKMAEHKITGLPNLTPSVISNPAYVNDTYKASTSDPMTFTVQQEPIKPWQETPLPTQFWTRPINSANRNWYVLAGDWLSYAAQNVGPTSRFCYGTGPESAHVMWATPMWAGGIMDARFGDVGYETSHYEGLDFTPPIILNGKIYYNVFSLPREGWYCLDLYTGETLFFHNTTGPATGVSAGASGSIPYESLMFGQIYNYDSPNQHGGFPYLWSTSAATPNTYMMFDAFTGNYICSINNVPPWSTGKLYGAVAATEVYGKDGSALKYNIANLGNATVPKYYLLCWNTSRAIWWKPSWASNQYWMWRPGLNVTYDGNNGYSLNASIPAVQGSIRTIREDQFVIGGTAGSNNEQGITQGNLWALNLKPAADGTITPTLLWDITFTPPSSAGNKTISMGNVDPEDGVFLFSCKETMQRWCYSLATGQLLWGPSEKENTFNFYGMSASIYQGKLLNWGYGGQLRAYNITTGEILWKYNATNVGFESPYGGNYPIQITCIADGKIYTVSGEHSPTQPLWRGSYLRCVNASNGAELWKVLLYGMGMGPRSDESELHVVIADGYLVGLNLYDNQIYCIGKGPSATTISASPEISVHGNSVLIKGMVTDTSPGTKQLAQTARFPNGVPAIADADMQTWMEYLYEQQAMPTNAKGVEVSLDAIDPNNNFVHIGTTTSDIHGNYGYEFTPDIPGTYQIIATFAGSKSYWSSSSTTYMGVGEAPPAVAEPQPAPAQPPLDMYLLYATIAIIVAIAIVGLMLVRILRKRP